MLTVLVDLKVLPLIVQVYTPSDTQEEKLDPSHVSDGSLLDQTTWPHLLYTLQSQSIQQPGFIDVVSVWCKHIGHMNAGVFT